LCKHDDLSQSTWQSWLLARPVHSEPVRDEIIQRVETANVYGSEIFWLAQIGQRRSCIRREVLSRLLGEYRHGRRARRLGNAGCWSAGVISLR
jgi:hypothetical protein